MYILLNLNVVGRALALPEGVVSYLLSGLEREVWESVGERVGGGEGAEIWIVFLSNKIIIINSQNQIKFLIKIKWRDKIFKLPLRI